ncbi:MAG: trehalose-phosphatase [Candidatus Eisenbacteria bacterium]
MKHLLTHWGEVAGRMAGSFHVLFLDYDGTLTPIVDDPAGALLPRETRELLRRLSRKPFGRVVVISGRALRDVRKRVGLKNIVYAGNHGLELHGAGFEFRAPVAPEYKSVLERIRDGLEEKVSAISGALVEEKELSLSLHYRRVARKNRLKVKSLFERGVAPYLARKQVSTTSGKMVLEVRPPCRWNKGAAVRWILRREKSKVKDRPLLPIYVGDDKTDEDAFRVLRDKGICALVGRRRRTFARYYLNDTGDVAILLRRLLATRRA